MTVTGIRWQCSILKIKVYSQGFGNRGVKLLAPIGDEMLIFATEHPLTCEY